MKFIVFLISVLITASLASPAHAQGRFSSLLDATEKDYQTIRTQMHDVARRFFPRHGPAGA